MSRRRPLHNRRIEVLRVVRLEGALECWHILELLRECDTCIVLNLIGIPDTLIDGKMGLSSRDDGKLLVGLLLMLDDNGMRDVVRAR